jgi:hypothetical protein
MIIFLFLASEEWIWGNSDFDYPVCAIHHHYHTKSCYANHIPKTRSVWNVPIWKQEQVNFQWDDDEVHFVLDNHA